MSCPHDFDWHAPDARANGHKRTAGTPQNVPGLLNNTSNLALLGHAAASSQELLNQGYPGAAGDPEWYLGSLSWLSDETPFGQSSNGHDEATGHQDTHHSIDVPPLDSNAGSSAQVPHIPTAGPSGSSRRRTTSLKERRSDAVTGAGPVKCEWKGCTYPDVFSRRIELKRHVETKHIFPRSYECPEPGCQKLFNRGDNLRQHLHRMH
ncbi:uncharacterized protein ACHE_40096A [Aspergillus chevalieri]|uniref:C2H2-type domain-containing protein n=1 Tax=Aspergillus chevalieri TaxID=182096 RepID=A0A7R7VN26_ASPCH|nr:uncharacterized protein ACHE_40096A [Aspergillus chevalieri]BCR87532.1 hypothetical protein ACHE_40096A [Aspergillus chevalieri]